MPTISSLGTKKDFSVRVRSIYLKVVETCDNIGNIVLLDLGALIIKAEAVGLHIVEPNLIGASVSGLGEYQNSGGNTCVGLEHT